MQVLPAFLDIERVDGLGSLTSVVNLGRSGRFRLKESYSYHKCGATSRLWMLPRATFSCLTNKCKRTQLSRPDRYGDGERLGARCLVLREHTITLAIQNVCEDLETLMWRAVGLFLASLDRGLGHLAAGLFGLLDLLDHTHSNSLAHVADGEASH